MRLEIVDPAFDRHKIEFWPVRQALSALREPPFDVRLQTLELVLEAEQDLFGRIVFPADVRRDGPVVLIVPKGIEMFYNRLGLFFNCGHCSAGRQNLHCSFLFLTREKKGEGNSRSRPPLSPENELLGLGLRSVYADTVRGGTRWTLALSKDPGKVKIQKVYRYDERYRPTRFLLPADELMPNPHYVLEEE